MLRCLLLHLLLFFLSDAYSNNYIFDHISREEGLSHNKIHDIIQDRYGFIWIATADGLNQYDGYNFKTFRHDPNKNSSLSGRRVLCILETHEGTLLIGTNKGLNIFDRKTETFRSFIFDSTDRTSTKNIINSIYQDSNKNIWICTDGDGLKKFSLENMAFTSYKHDTANKYSISSNVVYAIREDNSKNLWVATKKEGIELFNPNNGSFLQFESNAHAHHEHGRGEKKLFIDVYNQIWITSRIYGLEIFDTDKKTFIKNHPSWNTEGFSIIYDIIFHNNHVWMASDGEGIIISNPNTPSKVVEKVKPTVNSNLSSMAISTFMKDRDGHLWVGTTNSGLNVYHPNKNRFKLYKNNPNDISSVNENNILSIMPDPENPDLIWIGTEGKGLNLFNRKTEKFRSFCKTNSPSLKSNVIKTISHYDRNHLLIGTYGGGLLMFNKTTAKFSPFIQHNPKNVKPPDHIWIINNQLKNLYLVGTLGNGIFVLNKDGEITDHIVDNKTSSKWISSNFINAILLNKDEIWVGPAGNGIDVLDSNFNRLRHYRFVKDSSVSLSNNTIISIITDKKDNIWIGTTRGINFYDRESEEFISYGVSHGIPDQYITSLQSDFSGNIWAGTLNGLVKIIPQNNNKIDTRVYNTNDGLQGLEFGENAICQTKDGMIFIGGVNGLNAFNPEKIIESDNKPNVRLTSLRIFNDKIKPGHKRNNKIIHDDPIYDETEIFLDHKDYVFSIEFSAFEFISTEKVLYSYRLAGKDPNLSKWSEPGKQKQVTYTNIPHGSYTFEIKATNSDGVWNTTPQSIRIHIAPPFWKTPLAFILYITVFIFLSFLFRHLIILRERFNTQLKIEKIETAKAKELNNIKTRFFTNVSHEFKTPLTLITAPLEEIMSQGQQYDFKKNHKQFKLMYDNGRRLLRLVNQLLDFRKIEINQMKMEYSQGDIIHFIEEISKSFIYKAQKRNVEFSILSDTKVLYTYFDADKLDKILFNLLSNAFKYAPEKGIVKLHIKTLDDNNLNINISDSGRGIPDEIINRIFERFYTANQNIADSSGIGLSLTKELVELHGGEIIVKSKYPNDNIKVLATTFSVILPVEHLSDKEIDEAIHEETKLDAAHELSTKEKHKLNGHKPIILIIEDNEDIQSLLKQNLNEFYDIHSTLDGKTGWNEIKKLVPDLIITDIMLPGMSGHEILKKSKNDIRTSHIPIICLSAKSSEECKLEAFEHRADDYITKPFNLNILKARLKTLLENRKALTKSSDGNDITNDRPSSLNSFDQHFLEKASEIIKKHLHDPEFSPEIFAREIGMSRVQLYRKMNALLNTSVSDYIKHYRLNKAAELLKRNDETVTNIAYSVGYKNPAHFTVSFTKYFGVSPSKYS